MGEKFNAPDPGAGQSTAADETGQRAGFMKVENFKSENVSDQGQGDPIPTESSKGAASQADYFLKIERSKPDK